MATAKLSEYRKHIADAAARLVQSGILTKSNHGNISARIPGSDTFLLTFGEQPRADHHGQHRPL